MGLYTDDMKAAFSNINGIRLKDVGSKLETKPEKIRRLLLEENDHIERLCPLV